MSLIPTFKVPSAAGGTHAPITTVAAGATSAAAVDAAAGSTAAGPDPAVVKQAIRLVGVTSEAWASKADERLLSAHASTASSSSLPQRRNMVQTGGQVCTVFVDCDWLCSCKVHQITAHKASSDFSVG